MSNLNSVRLFALCSSAVSQSKKKFLHFKIIIIIITIFASLVYKKQEQKGILFVLIHPSIHRSIHLVIHEWIEKRKLSGVKWENLIHFVSQWCSWHAKITSYSSILDDACWSLSGKMKQMLMLLLLLKQQFDGFQQQQQQRWRFYIIV